MQRSYSVTIEKSIPKGKVSCPPSKSVAHRLLIASMLASGKSRVENLAFSDDILATLDCLKALGAQIQTDENSVAFSGKVDKEAQERRMLYPRESGSTLRFLIPLCLDGVKTSFVGKGRLMQRPMEIYENICREQGIFYELSEDTLTVSGKLKAGVFTLPGNVSSQFITGLLFALPLLSGDSKIVLTTPLESKSYLNLTFYTLDTFKIKYSFDEKKGVIEIKGNQRYIATDSAVEADHSSAAFFAALDAIHGTVSLSGLNEYSLQGDRVWKKHFEALKSGTPEISIKDCPDLGPILIALAAHFNGCTLTDTKRLKIKESDRGAAMQEELSKLGANITVEENRIIVKKSELHSPVVKLCSHNDHRIAMSLAVIATVYGGEIEGAEAVKKSLPDFFNTLKELGVKLKIH